MLFSGDFSPLPPDGLLVFDLFGDTVTLFLTGSPVKIVRS
jgi:hypothetical protein